jgi:hypothetical protein
MLGPSGGTEGEEKRKKKGNINASTNDFWLTEDASRPVWEKVSGACRVLVQRY